MEQYGGPGEPWVSAFSWIWPLVLGSGCGGLEAPGSRSCDPC